MRTAARAEGDRAQSIPPRAVVAAQNIIKRFPGVVAVDDVSLTISQGEILALIGQNGAGKSTLIQILSGVHPYGSYGGQISVDGRDFRPSSVEEAEAAGIAFVPQEVNVAPELSVAENMYLNSSPIRWGFLDIALRVARARKALGDFGLTIDPTVPIRKFDLATQQLVIIARALSKNTRLLILDEPTAALTEEEAERLFERMRALAAKGVAIIYVSHRLAEVFAISHRIVIMRDGRVRGSYKTSEVSRGAVVAQMVGEFITNISRARIPRDTVALAIDRLTVRDPDDPLRLRVDDLSFVVASGEIVGLFGLLGSGCIEAALAIYGAWDGRVEGGISIDGMATQIPSPIEAVAAGMGLMAQDRRDGLIGQHSVRDNVVLASHKAISAHGILDVANGSRKASQLVNRVEIRTPSIDSPVENLSGGNQQKVQAARWIAANSRILVLVDPTRGVDVGARAEIKRVWEELRSAGQAILIASTDTEELVDICDRVLVLRNGKFAGQLSRDELTEVNLLSMAANV